MARLDAREFGVRRVVQDGLALVVILDRRRAEFGDQVDERGFGFVESLARLVDAFEFGGDHRAAHPFAHRPTGGEGVELAHELLRVGGRRPGAGRSGREREGFDAHRHAPHEEHLEVRGRDLG
jgi:hypothetical protein